MLNGMRVNNGFIRSYDTSGMVTLNHRGAAIRAMLDHVDSEKSIKWAYNRYKKAN